MNRINKSLKYPALAGLALTLLAGCENLSRPVIDGQNATAVNGTVITANQAGNGLAAPDMQSNANIFSLRIFNPLADQHLITRKTRLNQASDLRVIHAIERTRQQILTQGYIIKINAFVPRPDHPDLTVNFADTHTLKCIFAISMEDGRSEMEIWNNRRGNESVRQNIAI
jgi:hypothetical protein